MRSQSMSDTGLYSGLYQQIAEYAELVDKVLISLKDSSSSPRDESRQRLGRLMTDLANQRWSNISLRVLALMLADEPPNTQAKWAGIGQALLSEQTQPLVVDELEHLAQTLEREQTKVLARIRGGPH